MKIEKETLISYQAKSVLQWKRFLWISNVQYLVRRTKYVALPFLQLYDVCFTETALESLSKTLVTVGLVQTNLLVLVARGVKVQPASYFSYIFVTRRQQIETSFFAWDDKVCARDIIDVSNNNLWYILAIGNK